MEPQNQAAPVQPVEIKKSKTGLIVSLVIALLVIAGGVWAYCAMNKDAADAGDRMMAPQGAPVSESDEVSDLDQDLKADAGTNVDLSGLDEVR